MRYPALSRVDGVHFVREVLVLDDLSQIMVDDFLDRHVGDCRDFESADLDAIRTELAARSASSGKKGTGLEPIEDEMSIAVFAAMTGLPPEALGDSDFWTFVAARWFWGFIRNRQPAALAKARGRAADPDLADSSDSVALERYVIGRDHYQIPLRMFLRGQAVRGDAEFASRHRVPAGTDFWRSHILAVRTAAYPSWARSVVVAQSRERLLTDGQRGAARDINRLRANLSLVLHDDAEAGAIVDEFWRLSTQGGDGDTT